MATDLWTALSEPRSETDLFTWEDGDFAKTSWVELAREAKGLAGGLREIGVSHGTPVGCVLTNASVVCSTVLAIWLAGGCVVSLPTLSRGMSVPEYFEQLRRLCDQVGIDLLLMQREFSSQLPPELTAQVCDRVAAYEDIRPRAGATPDPPADTEIAFIQFSSGSTSQPKGCQLTSWAVRRQLEMLADRLSMDAGERGVMWLPLSHDMGMFGGLLLPWMLGCQATFGNPLRFMRSPRTWFDDCAQFGATVTIGPNFALEVATTAAATRPPERPFPMGKCVISAERIDRRTLDRAAEVLGPYGLKRSCLVTAYGLAEATLAVTSTLPGEEARSLPVDPIALYQGRLEPPAGSNEIHLVSAGRPLHSASVEIDGMDTGEILVSSDSLGSGYVGDTARSAAVFTDHGLRTGDLGVLRDGELFVIGRIDDVLSIGGRQVPATEVEAHLCQETEVRPGCCALVDVATEGHSRVAVVAELKQESADTHKLAAQLHRLVARRCGAHVAECVFVRRGSLPKSPSGKVQRYRCRELVSTEDHPALLQRVTL